MPYGGHGGRDRRRSWTATRADVVEARLFKGIDEPATAWRERSIFNLSTFQVGEMTLKGQGRDLKAERLGGHWKLVEPIRAPGDDARMEDVLAELTARGVEATAIVTVRNEKKADKKEEMRQKKEKKN